MGTHPRIARGSKSCALTVGREYLSNVFSVHLAIASTAQKLTPHNTLQLNGVAEHLNYTLLERIRTVTHESGLSKTLWGKPLWRATRLKNRTVTRTLDNEAPFEVLYGPALDLSVLRAWLPNVDMRWWVEVDVCACQVR
jgi:hypothetical protein